MHLHLHVCTALLLAHLFVPMDTENEESGFAENAEQQDSGLPGGEWCHKRMGSILPESLSTVIFLPSLVPRLSPMKR